MITREPFGNILANAALARIYGYNTPQELTESVTDIGRRLYVEEGRRDEFVRLMQEQDTITGFESQATDGTGRAVAASTSCWLSRTVQARLTQFASTSWALWR